MFTLILPDFLRPEADSLPPVDTPALNQILRFARVQAAETSRAELYQNHLADRLQLPEHCAYASPVFQQTGMNSVRLTDGAALSIRYEEAAAWCEGLNRLYRGEAEFSPIRADLWQISLPEKINWQSPPLWDALGEVDGGAKAVGAGAGGWLQLSTELQMWLHAHPLNQNRAIPVNAVWLWRGDNRRLANPPVLTGTDSPWRQQSSLNTEEMPHDFATWQRVCDDAHIDLNQTAVFSEAFVLSRQSGDVWHYADILHDWETRFFAPVWQALRSGSLNGFSLICRQGVLRLGRRPQRRFWRRPRRFTGQTL